MRCRCQEQVSRLGGALEGGCDPGGRTRLRKGSRRSTGSSEPGVHTSKFFGCLHRDRRAHECGGDLVIVSVSSSESTGRHESERLIRPRDPDPKAAIERPDFHLQHRSSRPFWLDLKLARLHLGTRSNFDLFACQGAPNCALEHLADEPVRSSHDRARRRKPRAALRVGWRRPEAHERSPKTTRASRPLLHSFPIGMIGGMWRVDARRSSGLSPPRTRRCRVPPRGAHRGCPHRRSRARSPRSRPGHRRRSA